MTGLIAMPLKCSQAIMSQANLRIAQSEAEAHSLTLPEVQSIVSVAKHLINRTSHNWRLFGVMAVLTVCTCLRVAIIFLTEYRVFQKSNSLKLFGIFSLRLSLFSWNFAHLLAIHIHIISTNFCRFILIFHQMALIFPQVPIVFTRQVLNIHP